MPPPQSGDRTHVLPCYACNTTNDKCLALPEGDTCCVRCKTSCGVTHSRELVDGRWVALKTVPRAHAT